MTMPRAWPEVHAEDSDGEHADEDGRELKIGRGPGPEQLAGLTVSVRFGNVFVAARFHGDDLVAVGAVGLDGGFGDCHRHTVIPAILKRNRSKRTGNKRPYNKLVADVAHGLLDDYVEKAEIVDICTRAVVFLRQQPWCRFR